jgi:hypothetical protein
MIDPEYHLYRREFVYACKHGKHGSAEMLKRIYSYFEHRRKRWGKGVLTTWDAGRLRPRNGAGNVAGNDSVPSQ